jgi:hypothetical protein
LSIEDDSDDNYEKNVIVLREKKPKPILINSDDERRK